MTARPRQIPAADPGPLMSAALAALPGARNADGGIDSTGFCKLCRAILPMIDLLGTVLQFEIRGCKVYTVI